MRPSPKLPAAYLCRDVVDFRKGINGLSVLVEESLSLDPFSEQLFVFCNRRRNQVRILYWERNGFCLWQKRLEKARFTWPRGAEQRLLNEQLSADKQAVERTNRQLKVQVLTLTEQLNLALARRYAASSEKLSPDQIALFDEADDDSVTVAAHQRKRRGRKPLRA